MAIKWADVIKAWADEQPIQLRGIGTEVWKDYEYKTEMPAFSNRALEWRIAPLKPWYRVAKCVDDGEIYIDTCCNPEHEDITENSSGFVRWLSDRVYYD